MMCTPRALAASLVLLVLASGLVAGCSGGSGTVPVVASFAVPHPTQKVDLAEPTPAECADANADTTKAMFCMVPYLSRSLRAVYEPVVTQRGATWVDPVVVTPDADQSTACGVLRTPSYCPGDHTIVLPLASVAALTKRGMELLRANREEWADDVILSRYSELTDAQLDASTAYGFVLAFAHEYAHHVQSLVDARGLDEAAGELTAAEQARLSSRLELTADCLASWAIHVDELGYLSPAEEVGVLGALVGVGDDYHAAALGGAHPAPQTNRHGSIPERTGQYFSGAELGGTTQDPWPGCEDATRRALGLR